MNTYILLLTAIRTLRKHKVRSLLTILGILIGVSAIIVTFAIGKGAQEKVRAQIMAMGEDSLYIIPGNIVAQGSIRSMLAEQKPLDEQDLAAILGQCPTIKEVSREHFSFQTIEYRGNSVKDSVIGADETIITIIKHTLYKGVFFNKYHVETRANVAVLGYNVAQTLFNDDNPIGRVIEIHKIPFVVIGVLDEIKQYWGTRDINFRTFIPFTVAKKYFRAKHETRDSIGSIVLSTYRAQDVAPLVRKIRRILRLAHIIHAGAPDDFTIFDQRSISQAAEQASVAIRIFGLIAACISLLVGGIGIMNIMLVSVKERTKEIGIRLAIGATQWSIQTQFLVEAGVLSVVGGIMGIGSGLSITVALSDLTQLQGVIEFTPILISFMVTILVGIFFGYYPAHKASLLNPVDALLER